MDWKKKSHCYSRVSLILKRRLKKRRNRRENAIYGMEVFEMFHNWSDVGEWLLIECCIWTAGGGPLSALSRVMRAPLRMVFLGLRPHHDSLLEVALGPVVELNTCTSEMQYMLLSHSTDIVWHARGELLVTCTRVYSPLQWTTDALSWWARVKTFKIRGNDKNVSTECFHWWVVNTSTVLAGQ